MEPQSPLTSLRSFAGFASRKVQRASRASEPKYSALRALVGPKWPFLAIFGPQMAVFFAKKGLLGQILAKASGLPPKALHVSMKPYQARQHGQFPKFQCFVALGPKWPFLTIFGRKMAVFFAKKGPKMTKFLPKSQEYPQEAYMYV